MIRLSATRHRELLAIHGWSGLLLGLLLYTVICTGAVAVFADEIGQWSRPAFAPATGGLTPGLDPLIQRLYAASDPALREEVDLDAAPGGLVYLRVEGHGPDGVEAGVEYQIEAGPSPRVLTRTAGTREDFEAARQQSALADFFVSLHVRLHLPKPWGILLTGLLGLAMMLAVLTGLVLHRHLLAEAFTIRRHGHALLRRRDAHVVAGSWSLPFALLLAFTGSFFSFAGSVGLPAMAMVVYAGDTERAFEDIFGVPPASDDRPAPLADFDHILSDARHRGGVAPERLRLRHAGRADARVRVFLPPAGGALRGRAFDYAGSSGAFLGETPVLVGRVPSTGNQLAALMEPLHFGHFGGLLSRAIWFSLGLACAWVVLSGLLLWTRRRAKQPLWRWMHRQILAVGCGLPLALISVPWGYFGARLLHWPAQTSQWALFGTSLLLAWLLCQRLPAARAAVLLRRACGLGLAGLPGLRLLAGGTSWPGALDQGEWLSIGIDLSLLLVAMACLWPGQPRPAIQPQPAVDRA